MKRFNPFLSIILFLLAIINANKVSESAMNFTEYCNYYNYPIESHFITTSDGYILNFFRIQSKNQKNFELNKEVIYLQHGILDSSDTFIINEEEFAPGFFLLIRDMMFGLEIQEEIDIVKIISL